VRGDAGKTMRSTARAMGRVLRLTQEQEKQTTRFDTTRNDVVSQVTSAYGDGWHVSREKWRLELGLGLRKEPDPSSDSALVRTISIGA
jgi:hypothetical protein